MLKRLSSIVATPLGLKFKITFENMLSLNSPPASGRLANTMHTRSLTNRAGKLIISALITGSRTAF